MPISSPFYSEPQTPVPRRSDKGSAQPRYHISRGLDTSTVDVQIPTTPRRVFDPPMTSPFFDDQHKRWQETQIKIQEDFRLACRSRHNTDTQSMILPGPVFHSTSDAQGQKKNLASHPENYTRTRMQSFPPPSARESMGNQSRMFAITDDIYGPLRTPTFYPYPVRDSEITETTDNTSSPHTGSRHKRSHSTMTFPTPPAFSPTKGLADLTHFDPFIREPYQPLNDSDEEDVWVNESPSVSKIRRKYTNAGDLARSGRDYYN